MRTTHLLRALVAVASAAALGACTQGSTTGNTLATPAATATHATAKSGPVVARYGEQTLTTGELTAKLNERSPFERARLNTLDRKKEFVEQLVRFDLLAQEARKRGLDQDPEVQRAMQTVMVRKLVAQEIDENPEKKKFSDADLQAYYQQHLEDFVRPEMVRLSVIQLSDAKAAAALAKELRAKPNDYSAFGQAVAARSEDTATKASQGDLHFLSRQQLTDRYGEVAATAAFGLPAQGGVSEALTTTKGSVIFKLMGRTPAVNQTFEQSKAMLSQRVWFEKRGKLFDGFIDELKKKSSFSLDEGELDKFQVAATAPGSNLTSLSLPTGATPMLDGPAPGSRKLPGRPGVPAEVK
jgi:peptidyl-prolyl cis-trans isomerase C